MTRWTDERIPLWVPPVDGEALDSWIEAYARRLAVSGGEFVRFIGLTTADPRFMVRRLTGTEHDALARSTGLTPEALAAMTLDRFDGVIVAIAPEDRTMGRPPAWRHYGSRSRFCPACLADGHGRWQLSWRLPWSFACTRHNLLLRDYCPPCGNPPPVSTPVRAAPSAPGLCLHATGIGLSVRCGHPLAESPTPALPSDGMVIAAQISVTRDILNASVEQEALARSQELYALARRALRGIRHLASLPTAVADILAECGGELPGRAENDEGSDAHSTAVGTALAIIATDRDHPTCEEVFGWLQTTDRPRKTQSDYATKKIAEWLPAGRRVVTRMLTDADSELTLPSRLRYGTATSTPAWPDLSDNDVRRRASKLPSMIWPSWTYRLLPFDSGARPAGVRRACASMTLLTGATLGYRQAASLLGNTSPKSNRQDLDTALASGGTELLAAALPALARALDGHSVPIDYSRRRSLFTPDTVVFDEDAYQAVCSRHGWRVRTPARVKRLRWLLARLLLGADPGAASRTPARQLALHYELHPDLRRLLHEQASVNLKAHDIDEPMLWEPPPDWFADLRLPAGPETIDRSQLAQLASGGPSPADLARQLGLDTAHLHLAVETLGITAPKPARPRPSIPSTQRIPRENVLAPQRLRQLYLEQRLPQWRIAELAGCSSSTVRHAVNEAGITRRRRRPAGFLEDIVSRTWLETEYRDKGRSSPDIARELGVGKNSVMRLVNKWGIPHHPVSEFTNPFASLDTGLSPAMQAVSRTKNCVQRLRHLLQLPGHRNLQAAAVALNTQWNTLNYQLKRIEETAGFTIIERSRPLTATDQGKVFLAEAEALLNHLA
ncbi:Bacterial regulatory helix-turn-helix protein, lysR family [Streptomyces sp. S4.7]|uniref:TniQ family protein n=1 Tax=Streptomyces sp. S4.7 TaxID=2705439 RepID=UPI001398F83E|nr:TniQ family protein [Streptomyces sp. S4.7]QHY98255.1 Bacterial regulatory helix-turn-helix protein, lysR family [Streptomyces sp. S4.7]